MNEQKENELIEENQREKNFADKVKNAFKSKVIDTGFYKKWWVYVIAAAVLVLIIMLFVGGDAVQDDLIDYINNDITQITSLDSEVRSLYETARESSADATMYVILKNDVIPKSNQLIDKAEDIEVETEDVRELHEIYLESLNKQGQAFTLLLAAIEAQDYSLITQANEKLDESRKLMREYEDKLEELMQKHDVVYKE